MDDELSAVSIKKKNSGFQLTFLTRAVEMALVENGTSFSMWLFLYVRSGRSVACLVI